MKLKYWIREQRLESEFIIGKRIRIIGIPVQASKPIETICEGVVKLITDDSIYFEEVGALVWNTEWFDNCLKIQFVEDDFLPLTE
jgi:hypothetical protein